MDKISLTSAMVRKLVTAGIKAGLTKLDVNHDEPIEVYCNQPVAVGLTLLKPVEDSSEVTAITEKVETSEDDLRCGDLIIVSPCNDHGRLLVAKHGNVWRVDAGRSNKGDAKPHTWIITSVATSKTGKFAGTDRKHIAQENFPADQEDPLRWARVIFTHRFPDAFSWRDYYAELKMKNITITQLNTVNYDKKGTDDAKA